MTRCNQYAFNYFYYCPLYHCNYKIHELKIVVPHPGLIAIELQSSIIKFIIILFHTNKILKFPDTY